MPLQLPNLDDRGYNDLLAEALTLIPNYSVEWTNYNASDPGITVVEMFAYLSDMLLYRLDRITDANTRKFLKLLSAPNWESGDLRSEIRNAVTSVRERYRAVTKDDYEFLSTESFNVSLGATPQPGVSAVARAHCVPQRDLEAGTERDRLKPRPEHVSVVILPAPPLPAPSTAPQPSEAQIGALISFLDPRRMLTTKLHVVGPFYVHVSVTLLIARKVDAVEKDLTDAITTGLAAVLNPLPSDGGKGRPFGRDVFVSDIYQSLENIPGLDYIVDVILGSSCPASDEKCVVADPIWHANGDLIGLTVEQHHLAVFETADIVIGANAAFVRVELSVSATGPSNADLDALRRTIKTTVRNTFHPSFGGPRPTTVGSTDVFLSDIQLTVKRAAGLADPVSVAANCIPASILRTDPNRGLYIHVDAGTLVDWCATIALD